MVDDMSVTTTTTKLAMRDANIRGTYRRREKSPSPKQSDRTEVGAAVDNRLDNSKCFKLTPFEKPLFEGAIMSGKTTEEALSFARKTLFTKMRERSAEKTTPKAASGDFKQPRPKDDSPQKNHPAKKQASKIVGSTVHLSLVPFDVKNAPLSFTQMEQIQEKIIDMMIEHKRKEINPESLNCQFKTGFMAFKCNTATAVWLKQNCKDISKKCKVKLNLVEETNQDDKQNETKSNQGPRLKKRYYLALHHLKELNKAADSGEPVKNEKRMRTKYEAMVEEYLLFQKNQKSLRKILVKDGLLDRPKKFREKRYRLALFCLDKFKKMEENGTPLDEKKLMKRQQHQAVVDEYLKEYANNKKLTGKNIIRRPFNEDITDPLCVAVGGKRKGLIAPIPNEWPAIELQIIELVSAYVSENQDDAAVPRYDMNEVHRGFKVIKCMDEFSKKFLFKCIASLKDKWKELDLIIISASQIPKGVREPIDLKAEAAQKKINQTTNMGSSQGVKTMPSASFSTSARNMDFQTPPSAGMFKPENQHSQTSNPFKSSNFQAPQHHDLTEKTITSNINCMDNIQNSPRDLPFKPYLAQQPQTSRKAAEFSFQNRFNPLRSSDFSTHPHAVSTRVPNNFTESSSFREEFPPTSWRTKNDLNSAVESEFSDRFPASNETLRRSRERERSPNHHMLMNPEDCHRSPEFYANSGPNRTHFYQDSLPECRNPYSIDRLPASSRRSSEMNPVQTHTLNNSDDWRRSSDFYENSRSKVAKFYQDSPPHSSNAYRNEISMRSRERSPIQSQTQANLESKRRSSDFYERSNTPFGYNRSLNRTDRERELSPNEISMRGRKRNPTLMDSEKRRKSPDFHHPHRNLSPSDSFNKRYHKPNSFDILPTEAPKYNARGRETHRSDEFYDESRHRPNYHSQRDSRNNNPYSRREKQDLPSDDDDMPPPPPRWN